MHTIWPEWLGRRTTDTGERDAIGRFMNTTYGQCESLFGSKRLTGEMRQNCLGWALRCLHTKEDLVMAVVHLKCKVVVA